MLRILKALGGLISAMNIFAGVIGGIWLIILGYWSLVVFGVIAAIIVLNVVFPLLMLPGYGLMMLAVSTSLKRSTFLAMTAMILGWVVNLTWMTIYVYITYALVSHVASGAYIIPVVLFAYMLVAGPFGELTLNESDENPTRMVVVLFDLGLIIISIGLVLGMQLSQTFLLFLPVIIIAFVWAMLSVYVAKQAMYEEEYMSINTTGNDND